MCVKSGPVLDVETQSGSITSEKKYEEKIAKRAALQQQSVIKLPFLASASQYIYSFCSA